jgi:hypothetical protein
MSYLEHALHILSVLGFEGEELYMQAEIVARYLETNFHIREMPPCLSER